MELAPLWAAACAAPDDDAPRLVLQDALLEVKDPRGEFLSLQYKHLRLEDTRADRARMAHLLKTHAKTWLGSLAAFVEPEGVVFARGFAERVTLRARAFDPAARQQWLEEPVLPLVRELVVPPGAAPADVAAALRAPGLGRLGVITCAERRVIDVLAGATPGWTFRGVGLEATVPRALDAWDDTLGTSAFARCDWLVLEAQRFSRRAALDLSTALSKATWRSRVKAFSLRADVDGEVVGYATSQMAAALPGATLALEGRGVHARARGGDVELSGEHGPAPLLKAIAALHGSIGALRVVQRDMSEPRDEELDDLRMHLRRLKAARTSLPVGWGLPDEG